jgi:hypothetical protein
MARALVSVAMGHLLDMLHSAAFGRFPPPDGTVTVVQEPVGPAAAVLGFTAHFVVCAPVDPAWVHAQLPSGDLSAPLGARFVVALADRLGAHIGANDAVLAAVATGAPPRVRLTAVDANEHPRVVRAQRYRDDLRVWSTRKRDGLVLLGRGVAGRWEVSFEVDSSGRGRNLGSVLARAALGLLPAGTPVFAQVTPGNAASLRSVLAAGYRPVGSEVLLPVPSAT